MVEKRNCSFCGNPIEPGTGKMYIRKDGTIYNFCCNKCKKNRVDLGRVPRRTRWTTRYAELKASSLKRERAAEAPSDVEDKSEEPAAKPKKKPASRVSKKPEQDKKTANAAPADKDKGKPVSEKPVKDKSKGASDTGKTE